MTRMGILAAFQHVVGPMRERQYSDLGHCENLPDGGLTLQVRDPIRGASQRFCNTIIFRAR